jgi:imidazolonepropionase-like amidohydrolase
MSILDHLNSAGGLDTLCGGEAGSVETCGPMADQFKRNNSWWAPSLVIFPRHGAYLDQLSASMPIYNRLAELVHAFWTGSPLPRHGNWLRDSTRVGTSSPAPTADSVGFLRIVQRVGLPILAATDMGPSDVMKMLPGFSLHTELAMLVAEGITPLNALQSATINPAKMLRATDSLGTVAPGKLADLVLLDADPLADITNTAAIRAVVANGRYFDRAALDQLLAEAEANRSGLVRSEGDTLS